MKKLFIPLFVTLGLILVSGCSLKKESSVDTSVFTEQISLLQEQLSGLNTQIQEITNKNNELINENSIIKTTLNNSNSGTSTIFTQNEELKKEIEKYKQALIQEKLKNTTNTVSINTTKPNTEDRYRKVYSNKYSVYKKDNSTYEICLAGNKSICINLIQYNGKFSDYYKSLMPKEDRNNLPSTRQPMVVSKLQGKKERKSTIFSESNVWFNENLNGSLVMIIGDQIGEGFHGGGYDATEILKVIDF